MSQLEDRFAAHFGRSAEVLARAPGRLEILGNHTDYNQGFVLSCAVGQHVAVAMTAIPGRICRIKDFRDGSERIFNLDRIGPASRRDWSNYIKGVILELRKRGRHVGGFDAGILSTVPLSAGMSSSAALEVAFSYAFSRLFDISLPENEWAYIGQGVENDYLGLKTGLLDQFSSIFGKENALILSDFREVKVLRTVAIPPGYRIVVINSMVKHNLVDSEYNVRRQDCESATAKLAEVYPGVRTLRDVSPQQLDAARDRLELREYRRALHVVGENDRVRRGVEALDRGDINGFGSLLFESHESSRVNFENSTPEQDYLVELAHTVPGCIGARLSGGGFGGITVHLVEEERAVKYGERVAAAYRLQTGTAPEVIHCAVGNGAAASRVQ